MGSYAYPDSAPLPSATQHDLPNSPLDVPVTTRDLVAIFQSLWPTGPHQPSGVPLSSSLAPSTPSLSSQSLPKYHGRVGESLSLWWFQLNQTFALRNIPPGERLRYVSTCLGEAALAWLHNIVLSSPDGCTIPFHSWQEFEIAIKQAFEPPRHQQLLCSQLRELRQNNLSAQEYTFQFRTILGQITSMVEEDKVCYYLAGLSSRLRQDVSVRDPSTLEEACIMAIKLDQVKGHYHLEQHKPYKQLVQPAPENPTNPNYSPMELGVIKNSNRRKPRSNDYYEKKCSKCDRFGHVNKDCRTFPDNNSKNNGKFHLMDSLDGSTGLTKGYLDNINGKQNSLIILKGAVAGHKATILIDSGASFDYISKDFALQHNLQLTAIAPRQVTIADGTPYMAEQMAKSAEITMDKFKDKVSLHLFPLTAYDVILGKPFLCRHNPSINWRTNTMEIHTDHDTFVLRSAHDSLATRSALADDIMTISDQSEWSELFLVEVKHPHASPAVPAPLHHDLKRIVEEYHCIFQEDLQSYPPERAIDHKITLIDPDEKPICLPSYRMSPVELEKLRSQLDSLLEKGFIRPSKSPWGFPVLFAKKKDGSLRMCVDYRQLNSRTKKNSLLLPRIDEIFDRLSGATIFSKLDLASGYHQVRLDENDSEKTAFRTRYGHFEFTVLPFGLCNAPATFQGLMNSVFYDMVDLNLVVYLDDILIFSKSLEEHCDILKKVFYRLKENQLFVKLSKCSFGLESVQFLGHIIGSKGISVDPEKISAITEWPAPRNTAEIQSFLGLAGYYRKFVPNFAGITAPLTDLLRKDREFIWNPNHESSFQLIKHLLTSPPVLKLPDFSKPFILTTDASLSAIGGVLAQEFSDGIHPICYESKKLNDTEKNYPIHELECYAIVHCFKKFRCYIEGSEVTVETDHMSLKYLQTQKNLSRRMTRWSSFLQQFNFKIVYLKGTDNLVADAISRQPGSLNTLHESDWPELLCDYLREGEAKAFPAEWREKLKREKEFFKLEDDILFRKIDDHFVPFVAFSLRADLVDRFHHSNGHLGWEATFQLLKTRYWWPGIRKDVKEWVSNCPTCQQYSNPDRSEKEPLHPLAIGMIHPFSRWGIDFVGPLPKTTEGNRHLLVAVDYCTKWPIAKAVKDVSAVTVANFLETEIFATFGFPDELISDRGAAFNSAIIEELLRKSKVKRILTSSYHPRTNGVCERFNAVIGKMIAKFSSSDTNKWDTYVNDCLLACRVRLHHSTGFSPFYLVYGRHAKIPGDCTIPNLVRDIDSLDPIGHRLQLLSSLQTARNEAKTNLESQRKRMKQNFDKQVKEDFLEVGELVLVRNEQRKKFQPQWFGPARITAAFHNGVFELQTIDGKPWPSRIHRNRLKRVKGHFNAKPFYPKFNQFHTTALTGEEMLPT